MNGEKQTYSIIDRINNKAININNSIIPVEYKWFIAANNNIAYSRINYPVIAPLLEDKGNVITSIGVDIKKHFANSHVEQTNPLLVKVYFKPATKTKNNI